MTDLTLNQIINIVNNKDNDNNDNNEIKILNHNETENFENNNFFNTIFKDYVLRTSVIKNSDDNMSLFMSILYLVDDDYLLLDYIEQVKYAKILKKKIRNIATEKNLLLNLNLKGNGWNKKNLIKLFDDDIVNNNYVYFLAAYFNINIFLIEEDNIYIYYNDDEYTVYKYNFLIFKNKDIYEPIVYIDGTKNLLYDSSLLKNILNSQYLKVPIVGFNKTNKQKIFKVCNKVEIYNNDNDNTLEQSEDYYTEKTFTIEELKKKKKTELIAIAKEKKIPYSNKTKDKLIENILK